jgi:hypothetical protein
MDYPKMTYEQISDQVAALSNAGKTAIARRLLKRCLRKARRTRNEALHLFLIALVAHYVERDCRSALRSYGQALRRAPRNPLFLKSVENISRLVRHADVVAGDLELEPMVGSNNCVGRRKRTPKKLYCNTYDAVVYFNGSLAVRHV